MNMLSDENFDLLIKSAAVTMPTKIFKTVEMVEAGKLSGATAAYAFNHLAAEAFPGDKLAVSKFLNGEGQALSNAMVRAERTEKIHRVNPASEQAPQPEPGVEHPSEEPTHNATDKFAAAAQEMAEAHVKAGLAPSIHHAYSDLLQNNAYFRLLLKASNGQVQHSRASQEASADQ